MMFDDGDPSQIQFSWGTRDSGVTYRTSGSHWTDASLRFDYESEDTLVRSTSGVGTFPNGATNFYIITFWADFSGTDELKTRIDGVLDGTISTAANDPTSFTMTFNTYLGVRNNAGSPSTGNSYQGDMLEVVIYRPTGLSEIQDVESYMSDRYNITIS